MKLVIDPDPQSCGARAANDGAAAIRAALASSGSASIVLATGASQFQMLDALIAQPDIDWRRVTAFHLDEYLGLPMSHPASFRLYLWQRFASRLPLPVKDFHWIDGQADPQAECQRLGRLIAAREIDVAFVGIGENGHLAFNDPPADFDTDEAYLVVELDEACRRQQVGEGWFGSIEQVPQRAISMSMRQIMKSRAIVCTVPDRRKAHAVQCIVEGPLTNMVPASILQCHPSVTLYLDEAAAALLKEQKA